MGHVIRQRHTRTDPKTGKKKSGLTEKWYAVYYDASGKRIREAGFVDKSATEQLLRNRENEVAKLKAGITTPQALQSAQPIGVHLDEYEKILAAKDGTSRHVRLTMTQLRKLVAGCDWRTAGDMSTDSMVKWLTEQRANDCFGRTTSNTYGKSAKAFARWLFESGRTARHQLVAFKPLDESPDIRVVRRALDAETYLRLIDTTARNPEDWRGLSGVARAALYVFAASTGFRVGEIASLSAGSFSLGEAQEVFLEAGVAKNREEVEQPLPSSAVTRLRAYLAGRPADAMAWPGTWHEKAAKMMRADLKAAGIPYRDAKGRKFDFHALRGQFITDLARAGVTLVQAQKLARHSTPHLTAKHYTHLSKADLQKIANQIGNRDPLSEG